MSTALAIFSMLVAGAVGMFPLVVLLRGRFAGAPNPAETVFLASLSFPLGAGLLSVLHFLFLPMGIQNAWAPLAVAAALAACAWPFRKFGSSGTTGGGDTGSSEALAENSSRTDAAPVFPARWVLWAAAGGATLAVLVAVFQLLEKSPHGAWDSWAMWTLRAKFLAAGEAYWQLAVDPQLRLSHPEYPLLTSSFIAWSWKLSGSTGTANPQWMAVAYLISVISAVGGGLALIRNASLALIGVVALLSPVVLVTVPASLYADLPNGANFTAATLLIVAGLLARHPLPYFLIAGVFAGLCAWTKEEGLLHIAIFSAAMVVFWLVDRAERSTALRRLLFYAAGAIPFAAFVFWFRTALSPFGEQRFSGRGGSATGGSGGVLMRALEPERYWQIVERSAGVISDLGPWFAHPALFLLIGILLLGVRKPLLRTRGFLAGAGIVVLALAGYLAAFLLIAGRPGNYVATSLPRVMLHFWPVLVAVLFLPLHSPEDLAVAVADRSSRQDKGKAAKGNSSTRLRRQGKGASTGETDARIET